MGLFKTTLIVIFAAILLSILLIAGLLFGVIFGTIVGLIMGYNAWNAVINNINIRLQSSKTN